MPLTIHFLNVGHGDCTLIEHPDGALTMIDINNVDQPDTLTLEEIAKVFPESPTARPISGLNALAISQLFSPTESLLGSLAQSLPPPPPPSFLPFGFAPTATDEIINSIFPSQRPSNTLLAGFAPPLASTLLTSAIHTQTSYAELKRRGYGVPLEDPMDFLRRRYPRRRLFRYIQSHPDLDHMRGLAALMASEYRPVNFWDTDKIKVQDNLRSEDEADWNAYWSARLGFTESRVVQLTAGACGKFFNQDDFGNPGGHAIEILSPTTDVARTAAATEEWNDLSYVLRIWHAGRYVIFGADAGSAAWEVVHRHHGAGLKCDLLKASHHGRDSGYHQPAVKAMEPVLTVVSVGSKPETDVSNKYRQYSDKVWSTRWMGTISITIHDDGNMTYTSDRDP